MTNKHIVILGGGFAGVWASVAAARRRDECGQRHGVDITLISKDPELTLRPRLYERHLAGIATPLSAIADADSLVLATGSQVYRPPIPGISEYAHDVDTRATATAFWSALEAVVESESNPVVAVIGGGLTGVELATEIRAQLDIETVLIDSTTGIAGTMTPAAADSVNAALDASGVVTFFGRRVTAIDADRVILSDGTRIDTSIVAWTAGMHAHPLSRSIHAKTDDLGRLLTDSCLAVPDHSNIFAAGDIGVSVPDGTHRAPMSCQYAIPTGILAGYNAAAALLDMPLREFERRDYVTCIDLGEAGALLTQGWDRIPLLTGAEAKDTKKAIMKMIVPPTAWPRWADDNRGDADQLWVTSWPAAISTTFIRPFASASGVSEINA